MNAGAVDTKKVSDEFEFALLKYLGNQPCRSQLVLDLLLAFWGLIRVNVSRTKISNPYLRSEKR